jgi:hypothetical protein
MRSASCEEEEELMACAILQEKRNTTGEANITPAKFFIICVGMDRREVHSSQLTESVKLQDY